MTDVVRIAKERVAALEAEIGKLNDFIRMAEALLKQSLPKSNKAPATEDEKPAGSTSSTKVRSYSTATDGNGEDAEREALSVRELKAGVRVRKSRTTHSEPPPDRRGLFRLGDPYQSRGEPT